MYKYRLLVITFISLILSLQFYHVDAVVVVPRHKTIEAPPAQNCAYQYRIHRGLWKCYTESQWQYKLNEDRIRTNNFLKKEPNMTLTYGVLILYSFVIISLIILLALEIKRNRHNILTNTNSLKQHEQH